PPPAVTPPAPTPPDSTPGEAKIHAVAKGEYFAIIAKKYGVTVKAIEAANPGVDSTKLKIGQKLNIPAPAPKTPKATAGNTADTAAPDADGSYTVKSGDVLGTIAKKFGTTVAKLREANGLKTDRITVGQKLNVPAGGPKAAPAPTSGAAPAPAPKL
ncbi:MAG: LysM peptidoglycan-binding domain-containing protein, partial [Limisphaerales bacterium]